MPEATEMTHEDFVKRAIVSLRDKSQGIHTVYSGFNKAFGGFFEGANPIEATTKLAEEGVIDLRPCKGGVMIYLKGEAPGDNGVSALEKMGLPA